MKFEDMINTIQLGDCYELIKNIPDKSIDLVYIDIPYMVKNMDKGGGLLKNETRKKLYHKELIPIMQDIDYSIFKDLCRIMKYIYIYIWCSKEQIPKIINIFNKESINMEILVWCKTNPTPFCCNTWLPNVEYCLLFREKSKTKLNDGYELKSKYYLGQTNTADKKEYSHPTIKPLELVKRHILHSTQPNDIVLDCFCGSGTTCLAAKETGRRYIGMEIDPEYHRIAVNRLNGITANGQMSIFSEFK